MSKKGKLKTLQGIGLKKLEAELYIYLTRNDHVTAAQLAWALRVEKSRVYRSVRNLERRKMLTVTNGCPNAYSATPFGEVLDVLIQMSKEDAQRIEENRERFLSEWKKLT